MKVKSKISYLGERNSILPWQMAEQLAVEVDVKNMTHTHTQDKLLYLVMPKNRGKFQKVRFLKIVF